MLLKSHLLVKATGFACASSSKYLTRLRPPSTWVQHCQNHTEADEVAKCSVNIMNRQAGPFLMIDGITEVGFRMNNGVVVLGPMAIFPRSVLSWAVNDVSEITPASLALFTVMEPKLDCLIIGTGDKGGSLSPEVVRYLRTKQISFEALATEHAVATFNFINYENRCVAGVMLPPTVVQPMERRQQERLESLQRTQLIESD